MLARPSLAHSCITSHTCPQTSPPDALSTAKMRTRPRPTSHHGPEQQNRLAAARPTRKAFNCIVDDSALVAGVKKSTRNGIRQWVKSGQIRLFVPLHGGYDGRRETAVD